MKKPKTKRQLIKIADKWFSQYIRLEAAAGRGYCQCVTCGKRLPWNKNMHAGHFIVRQWMNTRYDISNVHPQCNYCNTFLNGNYENYYPYMLDKYNQETIDTLKRLSRLSPNSLDRGELEAIIDYFKDQVKTLRKKKGL